MSVPLDRLYNFLHDVCNQRDLVIYRFFPHGSRKITDLTRLKNNKIESIKSKKFVIFHDQEPLDFDLYTDVSMFDELIEVGEDFNHLKGMLNQDLYEKFISIASRTMDRCNLKAALGGFAFDIPVILVHSEQRSRNLEKYQSQNFFTVYWWSHAVIARDWFRYAEVDPSLSVKNSTKDFLIYNRAWTGTREYRLKFAELILDHNLDKNCLMGFNPIDNDVDYRYHAFSNKNLKISRTNLEEYFYLNTSSSSSSADYNCLDYQTTNIEVVLETLFDDDRLHLTEKILRPIACGQPFMLAATVGSLEYLRRYGFETYGNFINESYDKISDPSERLAAIVKEMQRIANLSADSKTKLYSELRKIASRNQKLFFSPEWHDSIVKEYQQNFELEYQKLSMHLREKLKDFTFPWA